MSIKEDFDYQAHYNNTSPDKSTLQSSQQARQQRRSMAKQRITIRLDQDVLEEFKHMANEEGYQTLINQALRQWLEAQSVKELLRQDLPSLVSQAVKEQANTSAA